MAGEVAIQASIIIPAYNASASLHRALLSARAQTLTSIEIIIVDDGSTDTTFALAQAHAAKDGRVRIIRKATNRGVSAARNTGIEAARGEWIALLDADDAYLPERLERLLEIGVAEAVDIVADNILYFDWGDQDVVGTGFSKRENMKRVSFYDLLENSMVGRSGFDYSLLKIVLRKAAFKLLNIKYIEGLRQGEDFMLYAHALLGGASMVLTPQAYYLYTERVGRRSRTPSQMSRTIEDCREMRCQTLSLLEHPVVERDPGLRKLVKARARAITRYESWERIYQPLRRREAFEVIKVLATDWRAVPLLTVKIVGRWKAALRRS